MKSIKIIFSLFFVLVAFASCMDDDITDYGKGPLVVQFENTMKTQNFLKTDDNPTYEYDIPVALFGGDGTGAPKPVEIVVSVAPSSTAVEGTHFEFLGGNTFTIPVGELEANLPIRVFTENLDATNPPILIIQIDTSSETVSETNTTKVVLQAICPSDLAGDWSYVDGRDVKIKELEAGLYQISADNFLKGEYWFQFSDVCGNLTVTAAQVNDFGYATSGYGIVNDDGTIEITYTIDGIFTDLSATLVRK